MTDVPATPASILEQGNIANRAMKFRLSRGGTQRRIRDKDAETLVKQQLGDEGQIVSRLLFKDSTNLVYQYQAKNNEMYAYHVKATLPFGDDSSRLLPNIAYFTYTQGMSSYISDLGQLKGQILVNWDALVLSDITARNNSLQAQGKAQTAKIDDYPTKEQMDYRLYINWYPEPVSTANDFRFVQPPEIVALAEKAWADAIEVSSRDRFNRMLAPVSKFIAKLNDYKGDKGQKWHDSFVDNLNDLSKDIPALNIKDDPMVDSFLAQIEAIIKPYVFAPDMLKEDAFARSQVKLRLEALESQLKGYAF